MHFAFTSSENKHTKWAQKTLALYFYFKQTSNHTCANHTFTHAQIQLMFLF